MTKTVCITEGGHFSPWLLTPQAMPCGCVEFAGLRLSIAGNILHLLHSHHASWTLKRIQEWIDDIEPSEEAHEQSRQILSCYRDIDIY